jgi:hypothetical protein
VTPRAARAARIAIATFYFVSLAAGVALGMKVVVDGYSPVPFADFWSQFDFIERAVRGDIGLGDLWAQHNEHRILLARLQFVVDYRFFGGTNVFLFASIVASCLLLAATFAAAVWLDTRDWLLTLGMAAVAGTSTMSSAGIENLNWSFQVAFVQVFLFAVLAIAAVVAAARTASSRRRLLLVCAAALAAGAATYSMANGMLTWAVIVPLAVALGLGRRVSILLAALGAAVVASFLWRLEVTTGGSLSDPVGLVTFVALYLGSAVWGAGRSEAALVGTVGLLLVPVLIVLAWRSRAERSVALPFAAGVATFVLLTAVQTAVGRIGLGTSQALSSRYSIASFTFWLALTAGLLIALRERFGSASLAVPTALACATAASLLVSYGMLPADSYHPTVTAGKELAVIAHRVGVDDTSGKVVGVEGGPVVERTFRWMQRERLGPWAPGGMVDGQPAADSVRPAARPCLGGIEWNEPVDRGRRLRGWIAAPDGEATPSSLVVLDARGRPRGLGLGGMHRPDVRERGRSTSDRSGFVAYVRGAPDEPVSVVLLDADNAVCRLAGGG